MNMSEKKQSRKTCRSSQYDVRDEMFKETCSRCMRARRCSFRGKPDGPECVCRQLVEIGKEDCEVCLRRGGKCNFECCFFTPIDPKSAYAKIYGTKHG